MHPITVYDTTLRDGAQREGLSLSVADKIRIARRLDSLGVHFIEGGWPGANPKDVQFFWELKKNPLRQAQVVAFCSTCRPGCAAHQDELLSHVLAAGTHWVTIFGKSWDLHVRESLNTTLDENLRMIQDTISYLKSQGRRVIYDAEHWFDGLRHNPAYALATLQAASQAGAEWLVLCDTNGGMLPSDIQTAFSQMGSWETPLGIHTHNDSGTAVANALVAVAAGSRMVQGTINGYGERCGNANRCTLLPNLQLKLGYPCLPPSHLSQLTEVARFVSEVVNLAPDEHWPFVGSSAFAHKGGIHVSAVTKNPVTYEHLDPDLVGNRRRVVISEQAGVSNILTKAKDLGLMLERGDPRVRAILQRVKALEHEGYQFEAAEASFALLVYEGLQNRQLWFTLEGFRVTSQTFPDQSVCSEATVKVRVGPDDQPYHVAAEGNGPVAALDHALRKALSKFYPEVADFKLTDYKVRILDSPSGTAAKTRVLIESSDGEDRWHTVGVSPNIIEASYQAVAEGIEYGLLRKRSLRLTPPPLATQTSGPPD
ncbi:citramalate synthase [Candidatus Cyanaurora vandensis]|uniref:citramalate synthase n=1 Tax=Candidatus Cyanaurora vandensis TaxID=2714958 RepID=UPI00257BD90E|nr:citramalate synthase [Candidatus Cyanaurora vandensis]